MPAKIHTLKNSAELSALTTSNLAAAMSHSARREYKPVDNEFSFLKLPFVSRRKHGSQTSSNWSVPLIDDYAQACDIGREYAAHFVQYLKDNPDMCGANSLGHIASNIDFKDESDAQGYWVGFFSHLERIIFAQAQRMDVFDDIDRINAYYAKGTDAEEFFADLDKADH
ncbi:hypothetical protein D9O50_00955 [Oxalobacteraceae bacterium CAVE-383]|nr:hypothetical protein D9O50_00955 [Oxalobacteraceae bacterium CAVE-383]